jgi:hypothetical protein
MRLHRWDPQPMQRTGLSLEVLYLYQPAVRPASLRFNPWTRHGSNALYSMENGCLPPQAANCPATRTAQRSRSWAPTTGTTGRWCGARPTARAEMYLPACRRRRCDQEATNSRRLPSCVRSPVFARAGKTGLHLVVTSRALPRRYAPACWQARSPARCGEAAFWASNQGLSP